MQYIFPSKKVYLAESNIPKAGRGVFATVHIKKKEIIEVCPVIELNPSDNSHIKQTLLRNYDFLWGEKGSHLAIGLGFSSLYNHSNSPNATYIKQYNEKTITYVALQDIQKDQEIVVKYNFSNPSGEMYSWSTDSVL